MLNVEIHVEISPKVCDKTFLIYKSWIWHGAKICKSWRARKMPTLAIGGVDTAEKGPKLLYDQGSVGIVWDHSSPCRPVRKRINPLLSPALKGYWKAAKTKRQRSGKSPQGPNGAEGRNGRQASQATQRQRSRPRNFKRPFEGRQQGARSRQGCPKKSRRWTGANACVPKSVSLIQNPTRLFFRPKSFGSSSRTRGTKTTGKPHAEITPGAGTIRETQKVASLAKFACSHASPRSDDVSYNCQSIEMAPGLFDFDSCLIFYTLQKAYLSLASHHDDK